MVGSGCVISTHNTVIDTAMSIGHFLLAIIVCRPLKQSTASSRTMDTVSQADVVYSCTVQSIIIDQATTQLRRCEHRVLRLHSVHLINVANVINATNS